MKRASPSHDGRNGDKAKQARHHHHGSGQHRPGQRPAPSKAAAAAATGKHRAPPAAAAPPPRPARVETPEERDARKAAAKEEKKRRKERARLGQHDDATADVDDGDEAGDAEPAAQDAAAAADGSGEAQTSAGPRGGKSVIEQLRPAQQRDESKRVRAQKRADEEEDFNDDLFDEAVILAPAESVRVDAAVRTWGLRDVLARCVHACVTFHRGAVAKRAHLPRDSAWSGTSAKTASRSSSPCSAP